MRTYEFFYFDSYEGHKANDYKKYIIESPNFGSAFKSFRNFLAFHESDYIAFDYAYMVTNDFRTQARCFTYNNILLLVRVKDNHNAKFWETYDGN